MLKEETLRKDMGHDIESKLALIGDRVLIQLDLLEEHITTASGIVVPTTELTETEGGRVKAVTSSDKRLAQGKIVAISSYAKSKLEDIGALLEVGDQVYVGKQGLVGAYDFTIGRNGIKSDSNGMICIPHTLIEAKIN